MRAGLRRWQRAAVLVCLLAGCRTAGAADALPFRLDHFTTSNGLPQNTVAAIAPTPDGYLWPGTCDELVRYDGGRATTSSRLRLARLERPAWTLQLHTPQPLGGSPR